MLWWGVEEGEALYTPVIGSQPFREPVPLDSKLHKCFSVSPLPFRWDRMAKELGISDQLGFGALIFS